jgi:hypothetical protein
VNRRNFLRAGAYLSAGVVAGVRPALAADAYIEITAQNTGSEISLELNVT